MKKTIVVEDTLFSAAHPYLYKHINTHQILVSSLIALSGLGGIVLSMVMDESNSILCMSFLSIGVMLLFGAFYRFFSKSREMIYKPTGSVVRTGSLYMETSELQKLQQMVKKNEFAGASRLVLKEGGNGRLDYLASKDGKFLAIQLFQFVPYTYESISDRLYYTDDDAVAIARCINI